MFNSKIEKVNWVKIGLKSKIKGMNFHQTLDLYGLASFIFHYLV